MLQALKLFRIPFMTLVTVHSLFFPYTLPTLYHYDSPTMLTSLASTDIWQGLHCHHVSFRDVDSKTQSIFNVLL